MIDGAGKPPGVRLETYERAACLPLGSALHPIIAVRVSMSTDVGRRYSRWHYSSCTRCIACVFEFKEGKRVHPIGCSRRGQHDSNANMMLYLLVNGFAIIAADDRSSVGKELHATRSPTFLSRVAVVEQVYMSKYIDIH
jgi:hypothetical protein